MSNTHRNSLSMIIWLVCSVLLAVGYSGTAAAISFSTLPGFQHDVGIDYSELTGNLVTSFDFGNGTTKLANVDRFTGVHTVIPGFVGSDELKVATARTVSPSCPQNAPVGTIFTGTGAPGGIAMVTPTGS